MHEHDWSYVTVGEESHPIRRDCGVCGESQEWPWPVEESTGHDAQVVQDTTLAEFTASYGWRCPCGAGLGPLEADTALAQATWHNAFA